MINIIFRTCEDVNSLHGLARPFNLTKRQTIEVCFKSLIKSLHRLEYKIYIVGDDISQDLVDFFMTASDKVVEVINKPMGNDNSLRESFKFVEKLPEDDIIYFVEDDYLHFPYIFDQFSEFLEEYPMLFIHPTDYPNFYHKGHVIAAPIMLAKYSHMRVAPSTTFTFMCKVKKAKENLEFFYECCEGADDIKMSTLFGWDKENMIATTRNRKETLISPIPGLATHMHIGTMSALIDWEKIVKDLGGHTEPTK